MAFRVYLSHSVAPHELGAVYGIAELAARKGIEPIVSDRQWLPDAPPSRIVQALSGLSALVVIATASGTDLEWVNAELAEATRLGLSPQAVLSVVDRSVTTPAIGKVLKIDRGSFPETISKTSAILEQLQLERNQKNLLAGLLLGGLAALLLASKD